MKRLLSIFVMVLFVCGMTFADGGGGGGSSGSNEQSQDTSVNQLQAQKMVGNGGVADNSQNINQNYESSDVRVGIIGPQIPYQLHVGPNPNQIKLWNSIGFPYLIFQGEWTNAKVMRALKHTGKAGAEWGCGFDEIVTSFAKYDATKQIKLQIDITPSEFSDQELICLVNVKAKKGLTESLALMRALKLAMCNGGELAVINPASSGMNYIMNGTSVGPGVSVGNAGSSTSIGGSLGFNLSDTKAQGEGVIILAVFKKNGKCGAVGQVIEPSKETTASEAPAVTTPPQEETQEKGNSSKNIRGIVPFDSHMAALLGFQLEEFTEAASESSSVRSETQEVGALLNNRQIEEFAKYANEWLSA